jgi:hypothetical protein
MDNLFEQLIDIMSDAEKKYSSGKLKKKYVLNELSKNEQIDNNMMKFLNGAIDNIIKIDKHEITINHKKIRKIWKIIFRSTCFSCIRLQSTH